MNVRAGDFPFSSPSAPDNALGPSPEGLFFCAEWREAVFGLVGVDCAGGWIICPARRESRRTGSCGARGGLGMRGDRGGAWLVGIARGAACGTGIAAW